MWSFKYSANWHQTVFGFPLTIEKFWVMRARMIYLEIETHSSTIKQNRFLTLFNHWYCLYMSISILLSNDFEYNYWHIPILLDCIVVCQGNIYETMKKAVKQDEKHVLDTAVIIVVSQQLGMWRIWFIWFKPFSRLTRFNLIYMRVERK